MIHRKSDVFFFVLSQTILLLGVLLFHAGIHRQILSPSIAQNREMVRVLGLTDFCLFTEARYTLHPTQADLHSALQDHPGGFDHFPSGSLLPPPASLTRHHAPLAGKTTSPD